MFYVLWLMIMWDVVGCEQIIGGFALFFGSFPFFFYFGTTNPTTWTGSNNISSRGWRDDTASSTVLVNTSLDDRYSSCRRNSNAVTVLGLSYYRCLRLQALQIKSPSAERCNEIVFWPHLRQIAPTTGSSS